MGLPIVAPVGLKQTDVGQFDPVQRQLTLRKLLDEQKTRQQDMQINDLAIQKAQQQVTSQAASQRAMKDSGGNPEKYFQLSNQYGVAADDQKNQMNALDGYVKAGLERSAATQAQTEAKTKAIGDTLANIKALPEESRAVAMPKAMQQLVTDGWMKPEEAAPYMQYQGKDWLDQAGATFHFHDAVEKQIADGRAAAEENRKQKTFEAQDAAGTLGGNKTAELQLYNVAKKEGYSGTLEDWLAKRAKEKAATSTAGLTLSPDAVDMAAQNFVITGTMPALGMGSPAIRQQILNRAGEIANNKGATPSGAGATVAANKAGFASDAAALTQLQKNRSAVGAFENTALPNLKLFEDQASKVVDSGSPWINQPLRSIARSGLGSTDQAAFDAARTVATTEIARVVAQPNLVGQLSDEARSEMQSALNPNATLKQILAASKILRQDMSNRKGGLDQEIANIQGRIKSGTSGGTAPTTRKSLEDIFNK